MIARSGEVHAQSTRPSRLTSEDRAQLLQYAGATWRSLDRMTFPTGLPADGLIKEGDGWGTPTLQTSPTNIGAYLWSVLAAERLNLISEEEGHTRTERTLDTLAAIDRHHGFYLNDIDPRTGGVVRTSAHDPTPRRPLVSCVDNGWLAASLVMVSNSRPGLRAKATKLLEAMNFRFFFDPYDAADPVNHPGFLRVGYWADEKSFYGHYGMLNTEARIASYVGIMRKDLPENHYYRLYRTLPGSTPDQEQKPVGQYRDYMGIKVFEGAYTYRGARIVPSWGGSMFEALMVTLFVPEDVWAPRSWGINHPLYVQAQIQHGIEEARYGFWGFSPANCPRGGYEVYGVKALGTDPLGYLSFDVGAPPSPAAPNMPPSKHGVVTPHAAFLALRFAPREAMENLRKMAAKFPVYSQFGFLDSVDVESGIVSGGVLALDQGMIMAAIANELADDAMQHAFSDGQVEKVIRPIIAMEEFSAGKDTQPIVSGSRRPVHAELTSARAK
ncbi:glucoamylase family protein [Aquisphaera giovannonii]|nr:glucoamylase family protein [Aquisphaera giovannonii]